MQQSNKRFETVKVLERELMEDELADIYAAGGKPGSGRPVPAANIPPSLGNLPFPQSAPARPPTGLLNPPLSLIGPQNGLIGTGGPGLIDLGALVGGLV